MTIKNICAAIAAFMAAGEEYIRLRRKGQDKLQNSVNESAPTPVKQEQAVVDDCMQLTVLKENSVDLVHCQESPMDEHEANEWKALISTFGSETVKTTLSASAFNGLLKCDVPLKELCRIKDNPGAMRGFVINNGKISKQASFSEIGLGNVTPLLVYQCLAAVTSQYYQQIITERLNVISAKIDSIIEILTAGDRAKLRVAYNRFIELSKKNTYDTPDKVLVSEFSGWVEVIRERYRILLSGISLNINSKLSDKKEAESKIQALQNSHYFDYLDMAMQSESLVFIASVVSMKVAKYLGNNEDVKIYAGRMSLDYWNNYVDQFNRIKHDVIKYLELEADASWMQGESITAMKEKQLKIFNNVEESMLRLQRQFECRTTQYIKVQEDGTLKKYISFPKS